MRRACCAIGLCVMGVACGIDQRVVSTQPPPDNSSAARGIGGNAGESAAPSELPGSSIAQPPLAVPGASGSASIDPPPASIGSMSAGGAGGAAGAPPGAAGSGAAGATADAGMAQLPNMDPLPVPHLTAELAGTTYSQECSAMRVNSLGLSLGSSDGSVAAWGPSLEIADRPLEGCDWPDDAPEFALSVVFRGVVSGGAAGSYVGSPVPGQYDLSDPALADQLLISLEVFGSPSSFTFYQSYDEPTDMTGAELPPRQLEGLSGTLTVREQATVSPHTYMPVTYVVEVSDLVLRQSSIFMTAEWPQQASVPTARLYW
jgi:hypothetical protein